MSTALRFTPSPLWGEGRGEGWVLAVPFISPLPLAGEGWGRGALACASSQATRRFRAPASARATSLLLVQKRSSQEKTTPRGAAFRPSMDGKSVSRGRAFRAGSCPREKASPSLASPAARPCRPRLTVAEGPRVKQARIVRARSNSNSVLPPSPSPVCRGGSGWVALAVASARLERAALPGAPMARRAGGGKSVGWLAWMQASFSPAHGGAVEKPRNPPAHPQGRMPGGRAIGVPFLFGSFLFGHAKRKELGHRQVDETALSLAAGARNRPEACAEKTRAPRPAQKGMRP